MENVHQNLDSNWSSIQSPSSSSPILNQNQSTGTESIDQAWDWSALLDFALDPSPDQLFSSWPLDSSDENQEQVNQTPSVPPPVPASSPSPTAAKNSRVSRLRKRDPRLVCENYLAGRVPCACPEIDALAAAAEEEEELPKKRVRAAGSSIGGGAAVVRCQVPGCEADINELKGYHRRHRVCLLCANASSVVLDGEYKRYCQQCGKFHILPDFDEGKRSCRRKLERHNKRRRRKPADLGSVTEVGKEQMEEPVKEIDCVGEGAKAEAIASSNTIDGLMLLELENGPGSPSSPLPGSHNVQDNSVFSLTSSGDAQIGERLDNSKSAISSAFCDNKSAYSSLCPTGRISFKLYDWNPAEFPRRLRHQIFQWLASMPVELEGYIRPGCTILTIFIAMPQVMWEKLLREVSFYVKELIHAPESLFVDGTTLMNIKMEVQVPKLHYVFPTYFEAGKPMEFVTCGSNLDQPKFRFLVSFAGEYVVYDSCCMINQEKIIENERENFCQQNSEHEMFKINISQVEGNTFGPAFIEVENVSGLSNFIPILIGNKEVCSELEKMQVRFSKSICKDTITPQHEVSGVSANSCELFSSDQSAMSELLLDIAWLLKVRDSDENTTGLSLPNIQRLTALLGFLIQYELVAILEEVITFIDGIFFRESLDLSIKLSDSNWILLERKIKCAKEILSKRVASAEYESRISSNTVFDQHSAKGSGTNCSLSPVKGIDTREGSGCPTPISTTSEQNNEHMPLVAKDLVHGRHCFTHQGRKWLQEPRIHLSPHTVLNRRASLLVLTGVVMCVAACVVLSHPQQVGKFGVTIRRCLFGSILEDK